MASLEDEVRALLDRRSEAMRAKNIDALMSCYSPEVVYFDIVPPLQYVGAAALRGRFRNWFDGFEGPIGQDLHDVRILADADIAVASMLIRSSGTVRGASDVERWVRTTSACQRSSSGLLITHEHVSLPVDLETGRVATDSVP